MAAAGGQQLPASYIQRPSGWADETLGGRQLSFVTVGAKTQNCKKPRSSWACRRTEAFTIFAW